MAPVDVAAAEAQVVAADRSRGGLLVANRDHVLVRPPSVVVGAPASPVRGVSRGAVHRAAAGNRPSPGDGRRFGAVVGSATPARPPTRKGASWVKGTVAALA